MDIQKEESHKASLADKIRGVKPVMGEQKKVDKEVLGDVLGQFGQLGCFDGDPNFLDEFGEVIEKEIKNGATAIGFFGSRAEGAHIPNKSDLDVVVINPSGKEEASMAGSVKYWGSKAPGMAPQQRIQIQKFRDEKPFGDINRQIVRTAVWVWKAGKAPQSSKNSGPLFRF